MAQSCYEAWQATNAWSNPKLWQEPLRVLSGGRFLQPNVTELITAVAGQVKTTGLVYCARSIGLADQTGQKSPFVHIAG